MLHGLQHIVLIPVENRILSGERLRVLREAALDKQSYTKLSVMDHVLPDAFDASQPGLGYGTRNIIEGRVKVDGMYICGLAAALWGRCVGRCVEEYMSC